MIRLHEKNYGLPLQNIISQGSTIGILGGGQLGRMLASAAASLGYRTHVWSAQSDDPAMQVSTKQTIAEFGNERAFNSFAGSCDIITFEFENVQTILVEKLNEHVPVYPSASSLFVAQDRLSEKNYVNKLGVETVPFASITADSDIEKASRLVEYPCILKTRRWGYDGKGQHTVQSIHEIRDAWDDLGKAPCVLEQKVDFQTEISAIVARTLDGKVENFEVAENVHKNGILHTSQVPAAIDNNIQEMAQEIAGQVANALKHVGILAIELFVMRNGSLIVNEMAPRVHNSGHWTLDACATSQFEQHIRAICGLPLGKADRHSNALMTNLIGDDTSAWQNLLNEPATKLHLYGKTETRPDRKMGHKTLLTPYTRSPVER